MSPAVATDEPERMPVEASVTVPVVGVFELTVLRNVMAPTLALPNVLGPLVPVLSESLLVVLATVSSGTSLARFPPDRTTTPLASTVALLIPALTASSAFIPSCGFNSA